MLKKTILYTRKTCGLTSTIFYGFYLIFRHGLYKSETNPSKTKYVQLFCQKLCKALMLNVKVHGEVPQNTSLWTSNHISFIDIPVLGSAGRVSFLSKAEIANWFIVGFLARSAGTLFIQRGSGDVSQVSDQMADYLQHDMPVVFFPEATTTNGEKVKKIYGKLFTAAIKAQKPLQLVLLCYVNDKGQLDTNIPFTNMGFVEHAKNVFDIDYPVQAHVKFLPQVEVTGHDVRSLTALVQQLMEQGLAELQADVLH